jgi:SAM-dependent methyltransferase
MSAQPDRSGIARFWGAEASRAVLSYPDENIVRFLAVRFPDRAANADLRAAELGCGNGRNLLLLSDYGFEPRGVDLSAEAVETARGVMEAAGRGAVFHTGAFQEALPEDARFDLIIWDSPYLDTRAGMTASFARVFGLLAPGGQIWTRFRHPDSWFAELGETAADGSITLDERAKGYAGALYIFIGGDEAERLLEDTGLAVVNRERVELWKNRETERHVWNTFWAMRPA